MPLPMKAQVIHSIHRVIRVKKEDAAFVYFILESHEGALSYSTLPGEAAQAHRDLELRIPPGMETEVERILESLREMIYELSES